MNSKTLLLAFFCLLGCTEINAQPCTGNCLGTNRPKMILDGNLADDRIASFINVKFHYAPSTRPEISVNLTDLKALFKQTTNASVSGIRAYFAQQKNDELCVLFVPTRHKGLLYEEDIPNKFQLLTAASTALSPISDADAAVLIANYKKWMKAKTELKPPLQTLNRKETTSVFYDSKLITEFYNTIKPGGCLEKAIKYSGIRFAAYRDNEELPFPGSTVTSPVGYKMILHFTFRDCNDNPINFADYYGRPAEGDIDTGLPCPDFCTGGQDSIQLKMSLRPNNKKKVTGKK